MAGKKRGGLPPKEPGADKVSTKPARGVSITVPGVDVDRLVQDTRTARKVVIERLQAGVPGLLSRVEQDLKREAAGLLKERAAKDLQLAAELEGTASQAEQATTAD